MGQSRPKRRNVVLLVCFAAFVSIAFVTFFRGAQEGVRHPDFLKQHESTSSLSLPPGTLTGHAIAPKLGNETAKAELGRAAWKLFHTTFARFPDNPTEDESFALKSYIHLFQRLYPCGECAEHFRTILDKFPPQVSSRSIAAGWGCHVHNEVNKSLGKELFDCSKIGDFYDCGCGDAEGDQKDSPKLEQDDGRKDRIHVDKDDAEPVRLEVEEYDVLPQEVIYQANLEIYSYQPGG